MVDGKFEERNGDTDDADSFWDIALMQHPEEKLEDEGDEDHTINDSEKQGGKVTLYRLPNTSITLELAQLPQEEGVWSPVGCDAWYASALLSCLVLQDAEKAIMADEFPSGGLYGIFPPVHDTSRPFQVLELGSGAKALSGLAATVALSTMLSNRFPSWTVTLTDNEQEVLHQMKRNVATNQSKIISAEASNIDQVINVEYLDWGTDFDEIDHEKQFILDADVVLGSELVYTEETATALVKILLTLLKRNSGVSIWIVQVTDRHGWSEIVLPTLESHPGVIVDTIPLTRELHDTARTLVPMGGALDQYAFGAVKVSNAA
ncbi:lysine methyltransferase [Nitzschia inconspicua]|uniref:Lysine methyltransferase n=1 Tax=Nitzschia inconspicua TaxID=303405 RepID=A0A9K3PH52_9STRA|nr:lysine methyltransferase [Nitzschia inconspicua]